MKNNIFLLFQMVKLFLIKKEAVFFSARTAAEAHSYFTPIFKIQIVKKIKAAIGFFCTQ